MPASSASLMASAMATPASGYPTMKSTPRWIRNRMSLAGTAGSGLKSAAVETMVPISG